MWSERIAVLTALTLAACGADERTRADDGGTEVGDAGETGERVCGMPGDMWRTGQLGELAGCDVFRGSLHVSDSGLTDLTALSSLRVVEGRLTFFRNEQLASATGLERLESAGAIGFNHHPELSDVSALANLVQVTGEVYFISNAALPSLTGLEGLHSAGTLRLIANPSLGGLEGLSGLETLSGNLEIRDNPALPQAEAEAFAERVEVGGSTDVSGNLP